MGKSKLVKVPQVMQMEAVECGAASLTMILAHYGKWLPLEEVRAACGVSRDVNVGNGALCNIQIITRKKPVWRVLVGTIENTVESIMGN